ncbi:MAG TPA: DUF1127 domain-containing protein [Alphaproteobacteria bacterium]|nr:DUF1127 domain-containing protein [Alphaproteobacteria bacterium]
MRAVAKKSSVAGNGFARRVAQAMLRAVADWRARQIALAELEGLDNHMLADIGICRGEIPGVIAGTILPHRAVNENEAVKVA